MNQICLAVFFVVCVWGFLSWPKFKPPLGRLWWFLTLFGYNAAYIWFADFYVQKYPNIGAALAILIWAFLTVVVGVTAVNLIKSTPQKTTKARPTKLPAPKP